MYNEFMGWNSHQAMKKENSFKTRYVYKVSQQTHKSDAPSPRSTWQRGLLPFTFLYWKLISYSNVWIRKPEELCRFCNAIYIEMRVQRLYFLYKMLNWYFVVYEFINIFQCSSFLDNIRIYFNFHSTSVYCLLLCRRT